ncbi:MAG: hypothetical protein IJB97_03835, partial [Clostridia bacterium]|nr:hypothetical protein [Clostridia bacterium]
MKKKTLMALATLAFVGSVTALGVTNVTAEKSVSDVFTLSGAAIRFMQDGETAETSTAGIRFEAKIKADDYNALTGVKEVGILNVPATQNVAEADMTLENVTSKKLNKDVVYGVVNGENRNGKFTVEDEDNNVWYLYRTYLYKIPEAAYYTEINFVGYYVLEGATAEATDDVVYYTSMLGRSIGYVATESLYDVAAEESEEYQYELENGLWSPYTEAQRADLYKYVTASSANTTVSGALEDKTVTAGESYTPTATAKFGARTLTKYTVNVTKNGENVELTDGAFVAAAGEYLVTYTFNVPYGDPIVLTEKVTAPDTVAPVITAVSHDIIYGVGEIALPAYTAQDETSEATLTVAVKDGNGNDVTVTDGKINATAEGRYNVTYTAQDEAGNTATASTKFDVVAADVAWQKGFTGTTVDNSMAFIFAKDIAQEYVTVNGAEKATVSFKARTSSYWRPAAHFSGQNIAWTAQTVFSFKIYNPTSYTYKIYARAAAANDCELMWGETSQNNYEIVETISVAANGVTEVQVCAWNFDYTTNPYVGLGWHVYENGNAYDSAQYQAMKLYMFDFNVAEEDDTTKPTLNKAEAFKNAYGVGEVTLPAWTATDDRGNATVTVAVEDPNGESVTVTDGKINAEYV